MPKITRDEALAIIKLHADGMGITAIAGEWGVERYDIYNALRDHGLKLHARPDVTELVELQRESNVPPELFAYREHISYESLRVRAWQEGTKLTMTSNLERKAFWQKLLETFDGENARAFCNYHRLPVAMTAYWYHRLYKPNQTLLWGFSKVVEVDREQVRVNRKDPLALFALGWGAKTSALSAAEASAIFQSR